MNLYKILFRHFSPKDSEEGIKTFLVADSDEAVYEWLKGEPRIADDAGLYNSWAYHEQDEVTHDIYDEDYNIIGTETSKERIIRFCGELNDDEVEVTDTYYGVTLFGWEKVAENVNDSDIEAAMRLGIEVCRAKESV